MKKLLAFIGLLGVVYALAVQHGLFGGQGIAPVGPPVPVTKQTATAAPRGAAPATQAATAADSAARVSHSCDEETLARALRTHQSRVEVCGRGVVARILKDDLQGSRHQRFIVRQPAGQTLLIAYNIDLAPRIDGLRAGSPIEFVGEYEWNPQGGVVHWTHHDPAGRHPAGWIRYGDHVYR
jgi:hypothetical protein